MRQFPPSRIVCLTEETVETLYLLGEQDRIVGVSGYAVRPPQVRREKPRVSAFTSADIPKILALEPDLVLTFSDLQAPIAADLIRAEFFRTRTLGSIVALGQKTGGRKKGRPNNCTLPGRCRNDTVAPAASVLALTEDSQITERVRVCGHEDAGMHLAVS